MSALRPPRLLSVSEYLAREITSPVKHEYVGGVIYAMAGARNGHNLIASNVQGILFSRLRGRPCRSYNSDTKIRIRLPTQMRFYYPDASVICRPNPPADSFQDEPAVIVEVLSERTRRIDEGEKREAYLTIPTLGVYLLVEQDIPFIVAFRRTEAGFVREEYNGIEAVIALPEIDAVLPLAEVYEAVEFVPEPEGNRDEELR